MRFLGTGNRFVGGHLHTIGNRCQCGHLTIPVSFHSRDKEGNIISDGKGEAAYLTFLASDEKPDYVNPPVMSEIKRDNVPEKNKRDTDVPEMTPSKPASRPKGADSVHRGRPKKWKNETERKAAYRERKAT